MTVLSTTDERLEAAEELEAARNAYFDAIGTVHEADALTRYAQAEAAADAVGEPTEED